MRPTYFLEISYIGSDYCGWQSQPHGRTIQDTVESSLKFLLGEHVRLVGASRTDAGVHATQQIAIFRTTVHHELTREFLTSLNSLLPDSIWIKSLGLASTTFHPSHDAVSKVYCYRLRFDSNLDNIVYPFHWRQYSPVGVDRLQNQFQEVVGTHDFASFCAADGGKKSTIRTIHRVDVEKNGAELSIRFYGTGFLKQMVRILVGTAIRSERETRAPISLRKIMKAQDRGKAAISAPANGLVLEQVSYPQEALDMSAGGIVSDNNHSLAGKDVQKLLELHF